MNTSNEHERRALKRLVADTIGPLLIQIKGKAQSELAKALDISVLGIGLQTEWYVDTGTPLAIQAEHSRHDSKQSIPAMVRHAQPLEDGKWHLGCEFTQVLKADGIMYLGQRSGARDDSSDSKS